MMYLVLAILTSTAIIVTFRYFSQFKISTLQAITVNYLTAASFGYLSAGENVNFTKIPSESWFFISLAVGVTLIVAFNLYALSARHAGMAVTAITGRMSVVIPVLFGLLLFGDSTGWLRITGIVVALVALFLTSKKKQADRINARYFYLPLFLFLAFGANDTLLKVAEHFYITDDFTIFLATAFLAALVLGILLLAIKWKPGEEKFHIKNIVAGIILGLFNWYSTLYFLKGINIFEVSVFIPAFNIGVVVLASISGFWLFKEKLSGTNYFGIFLAIIAILFLASG